MELSEKLKKEGWHLTNDAIQSLSENGSNINIRNLHLKALDLDLREIAEPFFPEEISKGKLESVAGNVIVQVQKVRNISAPKANEESHAAPRMLKLVLTDGHAICHALEIETINSLSMNSPPGTKLLLKGESIPMTHGLILLQPSFVNVLGGRVAVLVDKWELNRSLAKHTRGRIGEEGGPPPWIPFGQKIIRPNLQDTDFKSLGDPSNKENAEFEAQRQGAIAEAARGGARKVFGGGNKPVIDRNLRSILDLGYTQEQAEMALKQSKNNVDQALRNLKRREGGNRGGRDEKGNRRKGEREDDGGTSNGPKPSGRLSLFDFLEDKLPASNDKDPESQDKTQSTANNQFSNSYQKNFSTYRGRSERGPSNRGGRGNYNSSSDNRRDDRSRSNNSSNQNQKPPRFQNQQARYQEPSNYYQNWNYGSSSNEFNNDDRRNYGSSRVSGNFEELNNGEGYQRRNQAGNDSSDYSRNNRRYDNYGNPNNSGNNYRGVNNSNNYSRQMLDARMPEIPEFPFKDASSIPSLMSSSNTGIYQSSNSRPNHQQGGTSEAMRGGGDNNWHWKVGDKCMAKYWEDNMYYNAEVTGLSKKTCVVRFLEYGNFEEVLQDDCIPLSVDGGDKNAGTHSQHNYGAPPHAQGGNNHFSGILEFRRGGSRPYIKSADNNGHRKQSARTTQQMYIPPAQRKDIGK